MRPRRFGPPLALILLATAACGGSDPDPSGTAPADPPSDVEQLDALWADVADATVRLRLAETELIIGCLESEGFSAHNLEALTGPWSIQSPLPSDVLANLGDPVGLPDAAEAETRALGYWLDYARIYDDGEGVELAEAERDGDAGESSAEWSTVDTTSIESAGDGWDALPPVEQMEWEIAYRGADWAVTSKTASVLAAEDWAAVGMPDGEWTQADAMTASPQGCQGDVLTELYGEPVERDNGFSPRWVWGPVLDGDAEAFATPGFADLPEASGFLACLADAGHEDWALADSGGLDLNGLWRDRYLPDAAEATSDGVVEYRDSDVTDADRERYEAAKADEFAAAAVIAECDASAGYSEAANAEYAHMLTASFTEAAPAQRDYLADLEAALADLP